MTMATGCAAAALSPFTVGAFVMPIGRDEQQQATVRMSSTSSGHAEASTESHTLGPVALASGMAASLLFAASGRMQRAQKRSCVAGVSAVAADAEAPASKEPAPPPYNPADEMGVGPFGFFDPLGYTKDVDELGFRKFRTAELKHGRVAMMASVGAIAQHFIRLPGCEKATGTFGALAHPSGTGGFVAVFVLSGIVELAWREEPTSRWAGDYGDPLGVNMMSQEMREKEVNNGRMAMISVLGIFAAELVTGKDAIQQFGF